MTTSDDKLKALADALHAAGYSRFCDKSYVSPKRDAQLNLEGRTHYVDDSTLGFFGSRIVYAGDHFHGLIYAIVESVKLDFDGTKRGFRFVLFDVFGTVVDRVGLEYAHRTGAQARKAMYAAMNVLDVAAHYGHAIGEKCKALTRESQALMECGMVVK